MLKGCAVTHSAKVSKGVRKEPEWVKTATHNVPEAGMKPEAEQFR